MCRFARSARLRVQSPAEDAAVRWRPRLTLRVRLALLMVVTVGLIGGLQRLYLDTRVLDEFEDELELRALSFARHLSLESVNLLLEQDLVGLRRLLNDARDAGSDIAYIFILDPKDNILIHTFESEFPDEIRLLNRYRGQEGHQVRRIEVFGEKFRDFAVPLYHGQLGVLRLGVRDKRILTRVRSLGRELSLLLFGIMVVSATAAYLWTSVSLRPLAAITGALERFEPGRHHETIGLHRNDEIGDLAERIDLVTARLHNSHTQMMQTEKMVAAGLMASGIAHEINNPISGLQNCLRRIQAKPDDIAQIREYTAAMLRATEHMEAVVQSLLNFSRSAPKKVELLDLRTVVTRALALSEFRIRKHLVEIRQAVAQHPLWVNGDQAQLVQVVVNVVLNALDAMPEGGLLQIALTANDSQVTLGIRDNGMGIAPEHLQRIFEPFFTTKAVGKGTGLGLAVTQSIVLDHHGRISIDSAPGAGTEVKIQLPLCSKEQQPAHEAA